MVDRDELPETPMHRRGVPHGRHIHALAARGQQALEELFPGLTAELVADGAPAGDMLADARLYFSGHRLRQARTGLGCCAPAGRCWRATCGPGCGRSRTCGFVDRCDVVGLATTPDGRRVTGARVLRRADGSAEELLGADLVVDATGRGSRTPAWLEALGYARPRTRAGTDRAGLRDPDLPAATRTPSAATWRSCRPRPPSTRGPGPSSCSKATGGC